MVAVAGRVGVNKQLAAILPESKPATCHSPMPEGNGCKMDSLFSLAVTHVNPFLF
jgi:hypothetical protein